MFWHRLTDSVRVLVSEGVKHSNPVKKTSSENAISYHCQKMNRLGEPTTLVSPLQYCKRLSLYLSSSLYLSVCVCVCYGKPSDVRLNLSAESTTTNQ